MKTYTTLIMVLACLSATALGQLRCKSEADCPDDAPVVSFPRFLGAGALADIRVTSAVGSRPATSTVCLRGLFAERACDASCSGLSLQE